MPLLSPRAIRLLPALIALVIALCGTGAPAHAAPSSDFNSSCSIIGNTEASDGTANNLICSTIKKWGYPSYTVGSLGAGGTTVTCSAATAGTLQWTGSTMQYCDGNVWWTIVVSGGSSGAGTTPSAFSFTNQTGVPFSSTISSNNVVLFGFTGSVTAACNASCTGISRNGGAFVPGPVNGFVAGDTIAIQQVSSNTSATMTSATVTVGITTSSNWNVTTGSTSPFSFNDLTNQAVSSTISSNAVLLSGFAGTVTATCGPGCTGISINSGAYVPGPVGGIAAGNTISIQQTSSSFNSTTTTATVNVGGTWSGTWSVTTVAAPSAITFTDLTGINISAVTQATPVQVTWAGGGTMSAVCGTNCTGIARCTGATLGTCGGFTTTPPAFSSGDYISIQMTASGSYGTAKQATLSLGGNNSSPWTVTTIQPIASFNFASQTGVATGSVIKATPALISWTGGGTYTPTCGSNCTGISHCTNNTVGSCGVFSASPGAFSSGEYISIQQTSSASNGAQTTATLNISNINPTFAVTTLQKCTLAITGSYSGVVPSSISGAISYVVAGGAGGGNGTDACGTAGGLQIAANASLTTGNWTPAANDTVNIYVGGGGGGGAGGSSPTGSGANSGSGGGGGGGYYGGGAGGGSSSSSAGGGGGGGGSSAILAGASGTTVIATANGSAGLGAASDGGGCAGAGAAGGAGTGVGGGGGGATGGGAGTGPANTTSGAGGNSATLTSQNLGVTGGPGPGYGGTGGAGGVATGGSTGSPGDAPGTGPNPANEGPTSNGGAGGGGGGAGQSTQISSQARGDAPGGSAAVCTGSGSAATGGGSTSNQAASPQSSNGGGGGGGGCVTITYFAASCSM